MEEIAAAPGHEARARALVDKILQGDRVSAGRAITAIEDASPVAPFLLSALYPQKAKAKLKASRWSKNSKRKANWRAPCWKLSRNTVSKILVGTLDCRVPNFVIMVCGAVSYRR